MKIIPFFMLWILSITVVSATTRDFYQLKIYHLKNQDQENRVDAFLEKAYIPALHRANISHVGVFKPSPFMELPNKERLIYVFIPYSSFEQYMKLEATLLNDQQYEKAGSSYLNASSNNAAYERLETILLNAFTGSPNYNIPTLTGPKKERIYELRSYEGPTEKLYQNKVDMFNKGDEIGLFKRLGFNAVFYGEVLAGSKMPNLMYLTTFEDKQSRDEHWDAFGKDAYWKKLSSLPIYQNNVSHSDILLLKPTEYSDI